MASNQLCQIRVSLKNTIVEKLSKQEIATRIAKIKSSKANPIIAKKPGTLKYRPVTKQNKSPLNTRLAPSSPLKSVAMISKVASNTGFIFSHSHRLNWLNKKLLQQIGVPLCEHIQLVNVDNAKVIIFADNSSWAQRTRFSQDEIINILNPYCDSNLKNVVVQVKRN